MHHFLLSIAVASGLFTATARGAECKDSYLLHKGKLYTAEAYRAADGELDKAAPSPMCDGIAAPRSKLEEQVTEILDLRTDLSKVTGERDKAKADLLAVRTHLTSCDTLRGECEKAALQPLPVREVQVPFELYEHPLFVATVAVAATVLVFVVAKEVSQ